MRELSQPPNAANQGWRAAALVRLRGYVWLSIAAEKQARVVRERGPAATDYCGRRAC